MGDALEDLARKTVCPRCEARPDHPCMTLGGAETSTHTGRLDPLREAYARGYNDREAADD